MSDPETPDIPPFVAKEIRKIDTDRQVCRIRFNCDGTQLFGGGYDSVIRRWDFSGDEPQPAEPLTGHRGWVQSLEFLPNGETLLSVDSWGQLCAWSVAEQRPVKKWAVEQAHDGWIHDLSVSSDGSLVATVGLDRIPRVWSAADGSLVKELPAHDHPLYRVAVHADNLSIVTADLKGTLRDWSVSDAVCRRARTLDGMHYYDRIQDVPGIYVLRFDDDGTLICAGGRPSRIQNHQGIPTIHRIDWSTFESVSVQSFGNEVDGFVFDHARYSDDLDVAVTSGNPGAGQLLLLQREAAEPFFRYTKMSNCHSLATHPDGKRFVVSATNRNSQGNGAVRDKEGTYLGNSSPLHVFELGSADEA